MKPYASRGAVCSSILYGERRLASGPVADIGQVSGSVKTSAWSLGRKRQVRDLALMACNSRWANVPEAEVPKVTSLPPLMSV